MQKVSRYLAPFRSYGSLLVKFLLATVDDLTLTPSLGVIQCEFPDDLYHHHHRVACPWQDIAVSTSRRHLERSCVCFHAELRPRLWCWRSSSTVRSQVCLGRPGGRRQSAGRRLMAARRAREWSWDGQAWAMCPNRRSRLVVIR